MTRTVFAAAAAIAFAVAMACCSGKWENETKTKCATYEVNPQTGEVTYTECNTTVTNTISWRTARRIQADQWEYYYEVDVLDGNAVIDSWEIATLAEAMALVPEIVDTAWGWELDEVELMSIEDDASEAWMDPETAWHLVH